MFCVKQKLSKLALKDTWNVKYISIQVFLMYVLLLTCLLMVGYKKLENKTFFYQTDFCASVHTYFSNSFHIQTWIQELLFTETCCHLSYLYKSLKKISVFIFQYEAIRNLLVYKIMSQTCLTNICSFSLIQWRYFWLFAPVWGLPLLFQRHAPQ